MSSLKSKRKTIMAKPVDYRNFFQAKARLVNRHGAPATKYYLIIVFVVTDSTYCAACVVLCNLGSLFQTEHLDSIFQLFTFGFVINNLLIRICSMLGLSSNQVGNLIHLVHLIHYFFVSHVVSALLWQFQHFQKVGLKFCGIIDIEQKLIHIFLIPFLVGYHILNKSWVYIAHKLLPILMHFFRFIYRFVVKLIWILRQVLGE